MDHLDQNDDNDTSMSMSLLTKTTAATTEMLSVETQQQQQQQQQRLLQPYHRRQPSNQPPPSELFDQLARNNPIIIDNNNNRNLGDESHNSRNYNQQQQQQQRHHRHSSDENDPTDCFAVSPPPPPAHHHPYNSNPPFAATITETVERERTRLRHLLGRMGNYLAYLTLIAMLITLPMVLYQALSDRKLDLAAYNSAWIMVCGTIIMSVRLVYLHLTHWYMPAVQKYVVRILWMVPLYALQSYLSLRYHRARIYIDTVRDFYEAYVIASFVYYLMELLGGQDALVELLRHKDPSIGQHSFPLSLILEPWELGLEFMLQCKHGVLQYVLFKTIATLLTFLCEWAGVYGEGKFDWFVAYPYLCFFQNLSVMYALYCLVMLYHAVEAELRYPINWRPLGKFVCVKGIVFFCWWQGVVIFYLRAHGIIEDLGSWTSEEVANGLIDYCVVIEMVGFAIAHSYTFTYEDYLPGNLPMNPNASSAAAAAAMTSTTTNTTSASLAVVSTEPLLLSSQRSSSLDAANDHPQPDDVSAASSSRFGGRGRRPHTPSAAAAALPYRPPATLPQPMKFKDAFWSSTLPKETIQDLQKLSAASSMSRSRTSSTNDALAVVPPAELSSMSPSGTERGLCLQDVSTFPSALSSMFHKNKSKKKNKKQPDAASSSSQRASSSSSAAEEEEENHGNGGGNNRNQDPDDRETPPPEHAFV